MQSTKSDRQADENIKDSTGNSAADNQKTSEGNRQSVGDNKQSLDGNKQSAECNKQSAGDNRQSADGNKQSADSNKQSEEGNKQSTDGITGAEKDNQQSDTGNDKQETTKSPELSDDPQMVWLRRYFAKSLGVCFEPPPELLLDEVSFEGVARYIASDKCNKIVVMTGAGISTSAGIPDFRSPGTGCYERLKKEYNLENPQQLFAFSYFKDHPEPYYKYRKELWRCTYKPTPCHYFVRLLEKKDKLLRHFTQNIDGLETIAGISTEKLIQAHGTMATAHCMECGHKYTQHWVKDKVFGPEGPVPRCEEDDCGGLVRPDIVMFGENLPARFGEHMSDIDECDLLLIMGTSLVVQPFANLPIRTKDNVPRLYINLEKPKTSNHPISILFFGGGFDFDKEENIRDVFWQGTCDDGCYKLADLIGWGDELRAMVEEEHARLNKELGITSDTKAINKPVVSTVKEGTAGLQKSTQSVAKKQGAADVPKQGAGAVQKIGKGAVQKNETGSVQKLENRSEQKKGSRSGQKPGLGAIPKQKSATMQKSAKK